ncbi:MAG: serine/threonine protein kinase [Nannocystaceae bacterium]|nr:serine/threonine protein kinase [Nannocystaceae bacterium]
MILRRASVPHLVTFGPDLEVTPAAACNDARVQRSGANVLPGRFVDPVLIGHGAQGRTFRAFDTKLDRAVAVKVLTLAGIGGDWKGFELFERECAVLATLNHRGVPRYYEHVANEDEGLWYLVMELVEGPTLAEDLAQHRRRTEAELLALLGQLLDTLEYLHALRPAVIHRDIKPGNIIARSDGSAVLVDFGGVTHALRVKGGSTMIGTFGYMAPEQLYGRAGPSTDLYALGATIAALTGGVEAEDLPRAGMDIDVNALTADGPLRRGLRTMLHGDVEIRAQSVADVRAAIAQDHPPAAAALASNDVAQVPALLKATQGMTPRQRNGLYGSLFVIFGLAFMTKAIVVAPLLLVGFAVVYIFGAGVVRGMKDPDDS